MSISFLAQCCHLQSIVLPCHEIIIISFHVILPLDKCYCHYFADRAEKHYLGISWPRRDLNSNLSDSKNFDSYTLERERKPRHWSCQFPSVPQHQVHVVPDPERPCVLSLPGSTSSRCWQESSCTEDAVPPSLPTTRPDGAAHGYQ